MLTTSSVAVGVCVGVLLMAIALEFALHFYRCLEDAGYVREEKKEEYAEYVRSLRRFRFLSVPSSFFSLCAIALFMI